ncbi:hypothetical protein Rsub_04408 [Raphidocelis subcapitata]|uniref:Uncharacterized protein n=1 Tax=Raphidocelis subcapitata TaxID=307507 RepID=A0A2V0NWQ7_9CHLO|nr:hypothetical protein Rsub_04408 [Raphidocelis subcapitata]|eukprot:GBF92061.1 hypothetical protein Rsub_04408 [Raphidocelis subcapitata]
MQRRIAAALLLAACLGMAAAATPPKVVKVAWQPPGNVEDEMDRPKLLNCGDTLQLVCPPGQRHGVYKIANATGACPKNYGSPVYGDALLAPTRDCDLKIKLNAGDDYFLTSHVPGECQNGMKMLVKVFCDSGPTTTAKLKLGAGAPRPSDVRASLHTNTSKLAKTASGAGARAGAAAGAAAAAAVAAAALLL